MIDNNKLVTNLISFLFLFLFFFLAIFRYESISSSYYDSGVLLKNLHNLSIGNYKVIFQVHFQPYLIIYSFIINIFNNETLKIILFFLFQSLTLILPIIYLKKFTNNFVILSYLLMFQVWYNAVIDFHLDALCIFFFVGFYYYYLKNKIKISIFFCILLSFVKEQFIIQAAFALIFLLIQNDVRIKDELKKYILGLIVLKFIFFYLIVFKIIPFYSQEFQTGFSFMENKEINTNYFEDFTSNLKNKLAFIILPLATIGFYVNKNFKILITASPFLIFLLSSNPNHYMYAHHYTLGFVGPLICYFSQNQILSKKFRFDKKKTVIVLIIIFTHVVFSPSPISRFFWSKKISKLNYESYFITQRDKQIKHLINNFKISDYQVLETQNNINLFKISDRKNSQVFPQGSINPQNINRYITPDIIFIDLKKEPYLVDIGCEYIYEKCLNKNIQGKYNLYLQQVKKKYQILIEYDKFYIFKKN